MELSRDCWVAILRKLDDVELEPSSLVCQEFLSITNCLRRSLKVTNPRIEEVLSQLLKRFPYLEEIDLREYRDYYHVDWTDFTTIKDILLRSNDTTSTVHTFFSIVRREPIRTNIVHIFEEVACTMKNLKILKCPRRCNMDNKILDLIGNSFRFLEELHIGSPFYKHYDITDDVVVALASKLKNLKKISIVGYYSSTTALSNRSIFAFSSNCLFLEEVRFSGPMLITQHGVGFLLRHSLNLVTLFVSNGINSPLVSNISEPLTIENSIGYAKNLKVLGLLNFGTDDGFLTSIANARLPLEKIALHASECTLNRLSSLFRACDSLSSLCLHGVCMLRDNLIESLFEYLSNISCIECYGGHIDNSTFVRLLKNLPRLERIKLISSRLGKGEFNIEDLGENIKVQYLYLQSRELDDVTLDNIGRVCPELKHLIIKGSRLVTSKGVTFILKRCRKLRVLEVDDYEDTKIFEAKAEFADIMLEELYIRYSRIRDEGLLMIGMRFCKLKRLVLQWCTNVTNGGVKMAAGKCKRLKIIRQG